MGNPIYKERNHTNKRSRSHEVEKEGEDSVQSCLEKVEILFEDMSEESRHSVIQLLFENLEESGDGFWSEREERHLLPEPTFDDLAQPAEEPFVFTMPIVGNGTESEDLMNFISSIVTASIRPHRRPRL